MEKPTIHDIGRQGERRYPRINDYKMGSAAWNAVKLKFDLKDKLQHWADSVRLDPSDSTVIGEALGQIESQVSSNRLRDRLIYGNYNPEDSTDNISELVGLVNRAELDWEPEDDGTERAKFSFLAHEYGTCDDDGRYDIAINTDISIRRSGRMIYIKSTEAAQWTYPDYPEGSERKAFIEQPKERLIQLLIDTGQGKYVQAGWELYGDVHGGSIRKGLKTTLEPHKGTDRSPFRSWK